MLSRTKQLYLVTPAVYAAVIMGGGYGTGREVVEYFSRFGAGPGLLAIASSALAFLFILFTSFEVVRRTNQHDYRSFFKVILGRFWWLYEILYPLLFVLVIGVISASVVEISQDRLSLPPAVSLASLLAAVLGMTLIGKNFIEGFLTAWTGFMYCVFAVFLWVMWPDTLDLSLQAGSDGSIVDWLGSGLLYAGYNAAIFPVLLYAVLGLQTLQQSALVAALTPAAIHGTAFAMLTLMNNLLGLAPGPYLTGVLADIVGLRSAFVVLLPLMSLLSAFAFCAVGRKSMARAARVSSL